MLTEDNLAAVRQLMTALRGQRSRMVPAWKDITRFVFHQCDGWGEGSDPATDLNPPDMKPVFESTAIRATETFAAGLQGYAYGPSVDWFSLAPEEMPEDGELDEDARRWLQDVKRRLVRHFARSNFYDEAKLFTMEGVNLGTAIMMMDWDPRRGMFCFRAKHPIEVLGMDDIYGQCDTLITDWWYSKADIIQRCGGDTSKVPKDILECKDFSKNFKFVQIDVPTEKFGDFKWDGRRAYSHALVYDRDWSKSVLEWQTDRKNFSVWRYGKRLRNGFWGGSCPGLQCISDIKMLNLIDKSVGQAAQLNATPPIKKTKGLVVDIRPGGQTELENGQDFQPVGVSGNVQFAEAYQLKHQKAVEDAYWVSFFLALTMNTDRTKTATEVTGLQEEQSRIMSSFLSRLGTEFFEPVIDYMFETLVDVGEIDSESVPDSLAGSVLHVDFVSPLSRIQDTAIRFSPTRQLASDIIALSQAHPEVADKFNWDAYVAVEAETTHADMRTINSDEQVSRMRKARADAQAAAQAAQMQQQKANSEARLYSALSKAPEQGSPAEGGIA